ncbi:MAG: class I SAM-dependent methyltransferase [Novosphingobium sp.]|nr:class I SAM-dependent methyltransferase [Novosphingobium sp.]
MWLLDKLLKHLVKHGRLVVIDHDGRTYEYGDAAADPITVRLTDKGAALHIAKDPRMGAGEAYMDGRMVVEPPHDIRDMVLFLMEQARRDEGKALQPKNPVRRALGKVASQLDQLNSRTRASKNVVHHYGLTRQFYELFLDEDRQYTMAYFRDPANTLEQAQLDKKALIAAKLRLQPGMRVLDIGCGWGGLGLYLNRMYGCEVLGVSLAPDQVKFANERAEAAGVADKVKFELIDYRDVPGQFDRITSIGMLEHVGRTRYGEYFDKTFDLLANDGIMLTHTIGRTRTSLTTDKWNRTYIFPGHYLPSISQLSYAIEETGWEIGDIEIMRYHYAHTLKDWYDRACQHRAEIVDLFDERLFRMWQFYLVGAEQGFRHGKMVNFQIQSVKQRSALPMTRDYMVEEAERLRAKEQAPVWHLAQAAE